MGDAKLSNPRVHVIMVDGSEWDVQTLNMDLMRWERTAAKHKWPEFRGVPIWWTTFLAWSASQREGLIPSTVTWEVFSNEMCVQVGSDASPGAGVVDPTEPAPDID